MGSKSAKILQKKLQSLGSTTLRFRKAKTIPFGYEVISWGGNCIGKINTFEKLKSAGVSIPEFTTDKEVAKTWDSKILARTLITACAGRGIVICDKDTLVNAKLYVKFIDKENEYRVHVFNGEVIDYSKKHTIGEKKDIWNHDNGFVFVRNIKQLDENKELAILAVKALGLRFGAVDIIRKDGKSYVLEVNTACGMCESTSSAYANAIIKYANTWWE